MSIISKKDNGYEISITNGSIKDGYKQSLEASIEAVGKPAKKSFDTSITVKIDETVAAYIRGICSRKLHVSSSSNNMASSTLKEMISSPISIARLGKNGSIPELTDKEILKIKDNLDSVSRDFEVTFKATISNGATYTVALFPDARGFNIELIDLSVELDLNKKHPFVLSKYFIIDTISDSDCTDGSTIHSTSASLDDARVYKFKRTSHIEADIDLINDLYRLKSSGNILVVIDAYIQVINEMFWRSKDILAKRIHKSPFVNKIFGVGPDGLSFNVIDLADVTIHIRGQNTIYVRDDIDTFFVYGDILYPENPNLLLTVPKFDIISDSKDWTEYGPTSVNYVGDDTDKDNPAKHIFSWEGRKSARPKKMSRIAAQLNKWE